MTGVCAAVLGEERRRDTQGDRTRDRAETGAMHLQAVDPQGLWATPGAEQKAYTALPIPRF